MPNLMPSNQIDAKKALGQNFFNDPALAEKIIRLSTEDNNYDACIEIGPGTGSFTKILTQKFENFVCIEMDDRLIPFLENDYPNAKVIHEDFMKIDLAELIREQLPDAESIFIYGSLPYNISKKIIRKILDSQIPEIKTLSFIIQKEVAIKYIATIPNTNILSLTSDIYTDKKILLNIKNDSFTPRPNVTSSVIQFELKTPSKMISDIKKLEKVIRESFKQPRKTLSNNLKTAFDIDNLEKDLLSKRPAHLSLEDYIGIAENI